MKLTIDLIPRETVRKRASAAKTLGGVALGAFLLAAILFVGVALTLRARSVEASVQPLRERAQEMRLLQARIQPLSDALLLQLQRHDVARRLQQEPQWSALISDVAAAISGQVWIDALRLEQTLHSDAVPRPPAKIIISGTSATEADLLSFMNTLAASPRLKSLAPKDTRQADSAGEQPDARRVFILEGVIAQEAGAAP